MLARFRQFVVRTDGQDLIEYALLAALISVVSIAALNALHGRLVLTFLRLVFGIATA